MYYVPPLATPLRSSPSPYSPNFMFSLSQNKTKTQPKSKMQKQNQQKTSQNAKTIKIIMASVCDWQTILGHRACPGAQLLYSLWKFEDYWTP